MKRKKVFVDTEFTGLRQDTSLISIGAVTEDGQKFYAEFGDYNHLLVDTWIRDNVIKNLRFHGKEGKGWCNCGTYDHHIYGRITEVYGNTEFISECFIEWLKKLDPIEFWSDCLAYDWVLLNELWGGALNVPGSIYYIPFDICTLFAAQGIDPDISREEFAELSTGGVKHNALWDALVIKACYEKLVRGDITWQKN